MMLKAAFTLIYSVKKNEQNNLHYVSVNMVFVMKPRE